MKNIKILIIILLVLSGCNRISNPIENLDELNLVYAQSIKFPTDNFDVIVFQPYVYECGNMSEEEKNSIYDPNLLQEPFLNVIKVITNKQIIDGFEFDKFKNTKENKFFIYQLSEQ